MSATNYADKCAATKARYLAVARARYENALRVWVRSDARVEICEGGCFVAALVWIDKTEVP